MVSGARRALGSPASDPHARLISHPRLHFFSATMSEADRGKELVEIGQQRWREAEGGEKDTPSEHPRRSPPIHRKSRRNSTTTIALRRASSPLDNRHVVHHKRPILLIAG